MGRRAIVTAEDVERIGALFEEAAQSSAPEDLAVPFIQFHVPAVPVAQPRPKASVIAGHVHVYAHKKDHPVAAFKASVRQAAREAYGDGPPLEGALSLEIVVVLPRPQNMRWKSRPTPRIHHTKKPDCDNFAKAALDALTQLLFFDDSQIADLRVLKYIAGGDEQPHAVITIARL